MSRYAIHHGDCIDIMKSMLDGSVDSIVTDPPYELGFMGKSWDSTGIAYNIEVWREALRVLKPGGHILSFGGSRTYHRMACAIEDAGFEVRDQIMWVYGSGFPKSKNLDGDWNGWGTALKPAHEPICMARKPLAGTVAQNVQAHGPGALNIDGCRVSWPDGLAPEIGTPEWGGPAKKLTAVPGQYGATVERAAPSQLGRWPANLIHDGSDEVLRAFPDAVSQQGKVTGNEPTANGFSGTVKFGGMIGRVPSGDPRNDAGSAARFFYCAKTSKADREDGLHGIALKEGGIKNDSGRGYSATDPMRKIMRANNHPTVKPTDLMRYLCRLVTQPGGLVLDLFMGSGSTGKAAILEGFNFVGIDREEEYVEIAEVRIAHAVETFAQENSQKEMFA